MARPKIEYGDDLQIWRNKVNKLVDEFLEPVNDFQSDFESNLVNTVMDSKYFQELMEANNITQKDFRDIIFMSIEYITKKKFDQINADTVLMNIILGE